jgi:hypothetical protein
MAPLRGAPSSRAHGFGGGSHQFGMEAQHFLDVRRMCIERLDQSVARKNERLVKGVEMVHDAFTQASFRIAQANHRAGPDLASGNESGIGNGVSLSHESSGS